MPKKNRLKVHPKPKEGYETLCPRCGAACCNHIALEIDTPTTRADYDHIRWFLLHGKVKIFIDHDDSWNLEVAAPCSALGKDKRCLAYETRPNLCRDFPGSGDQCEFEDPGHPVYKKVFTGVRQFERWMKLRKIEWRARAKKKKTG